ncbi:MAG: TetR/AcrR family transcriptional regulator [Acidobacteriota bacterium]|nr:TetR/AcrR family transcriptional regulator [Acidobacteriota bacterium]
MSAVGTVGAVRAVPPGRSAMTRRESQAMTRAALLRAAARAISRHGLHGASIDRIAEEAGYTKGAFYANFSSKEELLLVMLDERFGANLKRLDATLAGIGEPAVEAREASEEFMLNVESDPEWPRIYQELAAHAARNEAFRLELAARQRAMRARVARIYARWAAAVGVEEVLPSDDVAAMTSFMASGFVLERIVEPDLDHALYTSMLEVFLRGLMATRPSAVSHAAPSAR